MLLPMFRRPLFFTLLFLAATSSLHAFEASDEAGVFQQQLAQLASKCKELNLPEQQAITQQWLVTVRDDQRVVYPFQNIDHYKPAANASQLKKFWYESFMTLRRDEAERLFQQAIKIVESQPAEAYRILHRVLHENHRHVQARKILNYSDSSVFLLQPKPVLAKETHPFTHWKKGAYYRISTTHFDIYTDSQPAAGVKIARQIEKLYSAWQQIFVEFWCDTNILAERFKGSNRPLYQRKRHQIILFSSAEDYQAFFMRRKGTKVASVGFYSDQYKYAFLYVSEPPKVGTWLHEVTHQLFYELGPQSRDIASDQNIWALEGVAMYMESLRDYQHFMTVGGFESFRLQFARYRNLVNRFYLPLEQLASLGRHELTTHQEIQRLYSQSTGLAHFFMDSNRGQYRSAFFQLLNKIYTNTDTPGTLRQLSGQSFEQLDESYSQFLKVTDKQLSDIRPGTELTALCLAHGSITDKGLAHLKGQASINWIDLTHCNISDASTATLASMTDLNQISLEGSRVTDAIMPSLANLPDLAELDLSQTGITDAGVLHLQGHTDLTVLWLTGTKVTNESARVLSTLANLQILDLSNTQMTESTIQQVFDSLPKLDQ